MIQKTTLTIAAQEAQTTNKMKTVFVVLAIVVMLAFTGCAQEAAMEDTAGDAMKAEAADPVDEGAQEFVDETDSIELGEML